MSDETGWKRMRSVLTNLMEAGKKYTALELREEVQRSGLMFSETDLEKLARGKGQQRWSRDIKNSIRESPGRTNHKTNNWPELNAAEEDGVWVYWLGNADEDQGDDHFVGDNDADELFPPRLEGQVRYMISKTRVRSVTARDDALRYHGYVCQGCLRDFEEEYRGHGTHCIQVHHLRKDLADYNPDGEETDPKTDLAPLCANCHSIVTSTKGIISISELRELTHAP